jgi:hypothetical protein
MGHDGHLKGTMGHIPGASTRPLVGTLLWVSILRDLTKNQARGTVADRLWKSYEKLPRGHTA